MKKLFSLLFIACAIMACSKDDNIITPQPESEESTVEVKTFPTGEFVAIEDLFRSTSYSATSNSLKCTVAVRMPSTTGLTFHPIRRKSFGVFRSKSKVECSILWIVSVNRSNPPCLTASKTIQYNNEWNTLSAGIFSRLRRFFCF